MSLYDTDYRYAIMTHPNSCAATYGGGTCQGVFENIKDQYFNENGTLVYINHFKFDYLTVDLPPINRKLYPTIRVNGTTYKIQSNTVESSLVTSLDLEVA